MDPQLKSILTSIGMTLSTSIAALAAAHGWINSAEQAPLADIIVSVAMAAITAGIGRYKAQMVSPTAAIVQVNSQQNGVKVVPATVPEAVAPTVNQPLK